MGTTADLIARVRDLMAEETADLYEDATELLPNLNDGKEIMFADLDVLPKTLSQVITGSTATYEIADLGRIDWIRYGASGPDLVPVHADELRWLSGVTGTPTHYGIGLSAAGVPQITLYPTPGATDTTTLVGSYFAIPADLAVEGDIAATTTIDCANANADLIVTAKALGTPGNAVSITLVDPGGATATLGVTTAGPAITVSLGRAASAITSTATLVKAAIDAYLPASSLVSVALVGSGAGIMSAKTIQTLSGGSGTGAVSNPTWHSRYHFLPCYHAAAILLRKDRRPEAATEMEVRFRSGIIEYGRWFESRFPYRGDVVRAQPSPMGSMFEPTYQHEIG
jgi:hypothetical protein